MKIEVSMEDYLEIIKALNFAASNLPHFQKIADRLRKEYCEAAYRKGYEEGLKEK